MALDDSTKAWIAGFFDGEGCVRIGIRTEKRGRWTESLECRLLIVNTDRSVLEMLEAEYGGSIRQFKRVVNRQQCYQWEVFGVRAERFVSDILPYARVKREQLELYQYARTLRAKPHELSMGFSEEKILERRRVAQLSGDLKRPHLVDKAV